MFEEFSEIARERERERERELAETTSVFRTDPGEQISVNRFGRMLATLNRSEMMKNRTNKMDGATEKFGRLNSYIPAR